jgi:hypothetical protein
VKPVQLLRQDRRTSIRIEKAAVFLLEKDYTLILAQSREKAMEDRNFGR